VSTQRTTQSTATAEPDFDETSAKEALVIRWVFPQPPMEPTWLVEPKTTFGRDGACSVVLDSDYVSRRHAAIARSGQLHIASDLSSKNGIVVNGRVVRETALSPGDVVRFGNYVGVCLRARFGADLSSRKLAPDIIGGQTLAVAFDRMLELAPSDLSVVLLGETGTGKERFARALHEASARRGPFRAVNCSVYSKTMAAAELFGYRKGAFTGAESASLGHIRAAEGGSLLLDELTELAPDVQAMLLRALENREILPLGEARPVPIDVRFLSATQTPLEAAVEGGQLRPDLRARLEGGVIALPPLRECREVVVEMFLELFESHTGHRPELRTASAERLCLHDWPLNVRELDTVVRRLAVRRGNRALQRDEIEQALGSPSRAPQSPDTDVPEPFKDARSRKPEVYLAEDVESLVSALARHNGNLTKAAAERGLPRTRAYRMLRAAKREK
jgi:DNA-binding NtrC family response regulator